MTMNVNIDNVTLTIGAYNGVPIEHEQIERELQYVVDALRTGIARGDYNDLADGELSHASSSCGDMLVYGSVMRVEDEFLIEVYTAKITHKITLSEKEPTDE